MAKNSEEASNGVDMKKEVNDVDESQSNGGLSLPMIQQELNATSEKFHELEDLLLSRDTTVTATIQDLFNTVKTLSYNQSILENKLDDALKNQINSDVLVNSINERLNKLSSSMGTITKSFQSSEASNNLSSLASMVPVDNGGDQLMSRPPTVRRGPGRPRKESNLNRTSEYSNHNIQQVKVMLPTGGVQLAKSKRYFTDPSVDSDYSASVKEEPISHGKQVLSSTTSTNNSNVANPIKRKRGRPPKKRTVETVIINENHINEEEDEEEKTTTNLTNTNANTASLSNSNLPHIMNADGMLPVEAPSTVNSPAPTTRSSSSSSLPSHEIPSTVATVDSTNYQENHDANHINSENGIVTTRIITPLARKKLLGANIDNDNIVVEISPSNGDGDNESNINLNRQQRELEKRRDSREKMLVNMKYNDREKAKSFMESNKKLLKAMRDEERRKRMTALIYDTKSPYPARVLNRLPNSSPSSAQPAKPTEVQPQVPKVEENNQLTKKIGISSILNTEESYAKEESPNEVIGPLKRTRTNEFEEEEEEEDLEDVDESQSGRSIRRRRLSIQMASPTDETGSNNEMSDGALGKKNESHVSLLLASPIELLCRDGFFYRRNMPNVPITTGAYLEFKFKPKQDELINLRLNQKDFSDKTKQNRMNAHFLKPEIEMETEHAFSILSNTTLTEKYVNSLEYFLMEFRWENKLVGLGLKLRESKRTWQRRKALFALFEFWRDQSREKRNFAGFTILHAVKEMENYRIFINRSVSWFYNHITLLKMILYDLCDNVDTQWREWMFHKGETIPVLGINDVNEENINEAIDNVLTLDFLDDGSENNQVKSSKVIPPSSHESSV